MSFTLFSLLVFGVVIIGVIVAGYELSRKVLRRAKDIERSLKMVPLLVKLPPLQQTDGTGDEQAEQNAALTQAETVFNLVAGTADSGRNSVYAQRHLAFEIVAYESQLYFYVIVPIVLLSAIEKALLASYPDIQIARVSDHNIFSSQSKINGVAGGEFELDKPAYYPLNDYKKTGRDALGALLTSLTKLHAGEGAAIQLLVRPASNVWSKNARAEAAKLLDPTQQSAAKKVDLKTVMDIAKAPAVTPGSSGSGSTDKPAAPKPVNELDQKMSQLVEDKASQPAFETLIRVLASSADHQRAAMIVRDITTSFAQFNLPGSNLLTFKPADNPETLATNFIWRFFPARDHTMVLSASELASLFHLPSAQAAGAATPVERTGSKEVSAPAAMTPTGLILGSNMYRGRETVVRLGDDDRRRHVYIIGQTGTGKSVTLENAILQDVAAGKGLAFIDPHGDTAEKILAKIPASRAQDVIYFNPADTELPLGLNLMQFDRPEQKDFIIQETIAMLYKLYDPGHTGIIGPRYEHWFRNAALTIMSDPNGATFLEIPKVFTDNEFLKAKFRYVTDPTVQDFWTKEMAQTSDYHKSEMLGWFVSKFGAFASNDIMSHIIGQHKSAFDIRQIMDSGKILIVNLSKGLVGEDNSKLLGMIFVIKFQAAAMSRSNQPESERRDFTLYVDEFQNFSTDSFATILSEARKYRLSLVVANQFIGQLDGQVRDAVFGNVGTIQSFRCGPEDAEFLAKQFAPSFDANDLVNLPNLQAALRLMVNGLPSTPFSLKILFPPIGTPNPEVARAIIDYSRSRYGRPKSEVDAEIRAQLRPSAAATTAQPPPTKQPALAR